VTGQHAQTAEVSPPGFVVALQGDGSADVTVTYTFDLSDDARRAAFEELRTNETAAQSFEDRFRRQLGAVVRDTANATGREMSVTDVDIAFETDGETGIVRLTATWEGLAATDGDRLTVAEPFASGFEPERTFVVDVPEGYAVDGATPEPDERTDGRLVWTAGSDLSGFEVTASPADGNDDGPAGGGDSDVAAGGGSDGSDGDSTPGESGPGFGPVVATLAVLAAALLAVRRR